MSELKLSKEIYSIVDINKANRSYKDLAEISYKETAKHYILLFNNCYYNSDLTKKEYENYLIDLMASRNGD